MKRAKKKSNKLAIFGIAFAVIVLVSVAVLGISSLFDRPGEPLPGEYTQPVDKVSGKVNVLVLGVDKAGLLTDTMIVVSYNTDAGEMKLLSIPRDTRMYIGARYQKINAAYAVAHNSGKNGAQGSVEAVTRLTGIPINYYVVFKTTALQDLVNALDGVYFEVPPANPERPHVGLHYDDPVQDLHIHLDPGYQLLDGDKAEQLVRFRGYRDGDIERVKVQQQFLQAVIDQKLKASIIRQIPDLFGVVQENIETNADLGDVVRYIPNLLKLKKENITMFQVEGGFNDTDYGASYWIPDMAALRNLVEDEFGYDASQATTQKPGSTGGDPDREPTKKPTKTVAPVEDDDIDETKAPKKTPEATKEPTESTDKPTKTKKPTKTTEPIETTQAPVKTEKPDEQPADKTEQPERTDSPTRKPQKPTANPVQDPQDE